MRRAIILGLAATALAMSASAQTDVGKDHYGGLHWSVAAPQGANWTLLCRFRPVTLWVSQYDRRQWVNQVARQGEGPQRGRLPGDDGRCTLTKTGGAGPVAIALVTDGVATAQGTADGLAPAHVNVF